MVSPSKSLSQSTGSMDWEKTGSVGSTHSFSSLEDSQQPNEQSGVPNPSSFPFDSGSVGSFDIDIESSGSLPSLNNSQEIDQAIKELTKDHQTGDILVQKKQEKRREQLVRKYEKLESSPESDSKRRKIVTALNLTGDLGPLEEVKGFHSNALKGVLDVFCEEDSSEDVQKLALAYQAFVFKDYLSTHKPPLGGLYMIRPSTTRLGVAVVALADKALNKVRMLRLEHLKLTDKWHCRVLCLVPQLMNFVSPTIGQLKQKILAHFQGGSCKITMSSLSKAKGVATHSKNSLSTAFVASFLQQEKLWKASVKVPKSELRDYHKKSIVKLIGLIALDVFGLTQLSPVPLPSADVDEQFVQYWKETTQSTTTTSQGTGLQNKS